MTRVIDLPNRLDQVYSYVQDYIAQHGYAPTYREIMVACQFASTASVRDYLERLELAGRIHFTPGISRGIAIAPQDIDEKT